MPGSRNRSFRRHLPILTFGVLALALAGCSTSSNVATERTIAPENLEVAKRKTLAMVEFTGEAGGRLSRRLAKRLARVRIDGERLFAITGPVALRAGGDREIDEVGSAEALELARNLGVRAVIQGRATLRKDTDFDVPVTESACVKRSSKNKKRCIERQTLIIHCAELSVALKYNVLALETTGGRLIYDPGVKRLVERHRDCVRYPAEQAYAAVERLEDKLEEAAGELRSVLLAEAVDRIHHDIAPYTKTFAVTFLTEPDVLAGAPAERFAVAADLIKDRRFRAGCRIWRGMVEAGRHDPALTYNLAACAEQDENYGVARQFYALTQRHADGLQARAGGEDRTYSYEDWSKLVAMAQERVGLLHRSQQAINVLRAEPLP